MDAVDYPRYAFVWQAALRRLFNLEGGIATDIPADRLSRSEREGFVRKLLEWSWLEVQQRHAGLQVGRHRLTKE